MCLLIDVLISYPESSGCLVSGSSLGGGTGLLEFCYHRISALKQYFFRILQSLSWRPSGKKPEDSDYTIEMCFKISLNILVDVTTKRG